MPGGAAELWQFALHFYQRDGARPWLLDLQDTAAADVCLLLGLLWLGGQGLRPDTSQHDALARAVLGWQRPVTERLRRWRRAAGRGGLRYRLLLALELQAERQALRRFARQARMLYPAAAPGPAGFDVDAALHNIEHYLTSLPSLVAGDRAARHAELRTLLMQPDALN